MAFFFFCRKRVPEQRGGPTNKLTFAIIESHDLRFAKRTFQRCSQVVQPSLVGGKNIEVFGPCANENWHGHNFDLIVTVKGHPDRDTGFVVDLKRLSTMIRREVIDKLDHKNLNVDVPFMQGKLASCENLAVEIWKILESHLHEVTVHGELHSIRLYETPRNYVEYFGEV